MKNKKVDFKVISAYAVLIGSVILIITDIIVVENFDDGFWLRTLSSTLVIIAMSFSIFSYKKI